MSVCEIRIPLGVQHWRASDDRAEFRKLARFVTPLYWPDLSNPDVIERYERNLEFFFTTYRVGERAAVVKIRVVSGLEGDVVSAHVGGCVGDFLRIGDRLDALIGFQNSEYVSVEFSHGMRDTLTAPPPDSPVVVEAVRQTASGMLSLEWADYHDAAPMIGEALHNARSFIRLFAGDDAPMNACLRQIDLAMAAIPVRFRPKD